MKKILILGGTQFIGRNLVKRLIATESYDITLFNRQRTGADLFPNIHKIKGDRMTDDIQQIAPHDWDFVIDCSCYHPTDLKNTLACLNDNLERYIFISTSSVYDNKALLSVLRNETAPILECTKEQQDSRALYQYYGNKKAKCEAILTQSKFDYKILRPALVFGAFDYTDRFYYWLHQVKTKETLCLPNNGNSLFSITYVNDLVESIVQSLTVKTISKVFNVTTIPQLSIRQIVLTAQQLLSKSNTLINIPPKFLHDNEISQWTTMPLWIDNDYYTYNNNRLTSEFPIKLTDFQTATTETINYYETLNWPQPKYGMTEAERQKLLQQFS